LLEEWVGSCGRLGWYAKPILWCDMLYLSTAIGLPPGGSCTVHIYTHTIHRTTQNKQYIEQHKNSEDGNMASFRGAFLGAFAKFRKATISFVVSVRSHGTCRLKLDGFLWNLVFEGFSKMCWKVKVSLKTDKNDEYMQIHVDLW
jgi:hypothetical protein